MVLHSNGERTVRCIGVCVLSHCSVQTSKNRFFNWSVWTLHIW